MDLFDHAADLFETSELVRMAETLKLAPTSAWTSRVLISTINSKIHTGGIPAYIVNKEKLSPEQLLVQDLLYVLHYIDAEGKVTDSALKKEEMRIGLDQFCVNHGIKQKPACLGNADDEDPSCSHCLLYKFCAQERLSNLPACYGLLCDMTNEKCITCIDSPFCVVSHAEYVRKSKTNLSTEVKLL